jgi:integrase
MNPLKLENTTLQGGNSLDFGFKSGFSSKLNYLVKQKRSLGISFSTGMMYLQHFDEMCCKRYPDANVLTKEICLAFAIKRPTENGTTFRNRISPLREFAKFLIARGEDAYVIPTDLAKKSPKHLPYIYSKEDISAIWNELDNMEPVSYLPARHLTLPAIMRTIYCCGLRPIEATRFEPSDVDLSTGQLYIRESKGHKDRIVMMADDLTEFLSAYNDKISSMFPNRKWFFVDYSGGFCKNKWLNVAFLPIRRKLGLCGINGKLPRLYDFRHTFATHRLYLWMREGADLDAKLPYLSAYMGHVQLSDTYYYIHLVPEQYEAMSGFDFSRFEGLLPDISDSSLAPYVPYNMGGVAI